MGLGQEAAFEFKYIPDLSKHTRKEDILGENMRWAGIERRNFQALLIGCLLLGITIAGSLKAVLKLILWSTRG